MNELKETASKNITVEITTLTNGGDGLGRVGGKAVFVNGAIPGDVVSCRLMVDKKRYAKGALLQVLTPSPTRIEPVCQYFNSCGGCDWQQMSYQQQCYWKELLLRQNCQHQLDIDDAVLRPLLTSATQLGYRSRVQFKCSNNGGRFKLGFYRRSSHSVVDIVSCPVVVSAINQLIPQLRELFAGSEYADQVQQIDVATGDGVVGDAIVDRARVVIHCYDNSVDKLSNWLLKRCSGIAATIFIQGKRTSAQLLQGSADLTITVDATDQKTPLHLSYSVGGFAQINLAQNRVLVDLVVALAHVNSSDTLLDLYCGMGNFSLPLARLAHRIIGVEGSDTSIVSAKQNAKLNGIDNTEFHCHSVEKFMATFGENIDVVVLDPPRAGAKEVVAAIVAKNPRRIVYVSCDQQTLLRDLQTFTAESYQIKVIQPVDMFPQTAHTEVVAVLDKMNNVHME